MPSPDRTGTGSPAVPSRAGSSLIVPAVCAAGGTTSLYVYFDNPAAWAVPDFLTASLGVQNGSLENGAGATPAGWMHDYGDAQHVASWITERAHTGTHALKLWVAEGAAPTWISTRQSDIAIRPGAHYILSGWVKAENVSAGGYAGLYIHVGNAADPMLLNPPVSAGDGTYDWREVRFEFDALETADRAELGTVLWGSGNGVVRRYQPRMHYPARHQCGRRPAGGYHGGRDRGKRRMVRR